MTTIKQILEQAFKEHQYDIEIITFGLNDYDPCTFEPIGDKLRFKIGDHILRALATNIDDANPSEKERKFVDEFEDYLPEVAAMAFTDIKDEIITTFIEQNTNR